jgi:RHS repeat-associated protein
VTTYAVYDAAGRTIRSYGVGATGTDARTTVTVHYTAGTNSGDSSCGGKPQWAGWPCLISAGGAATGHDPARMPAGLPVTRVTEYTRSGDPRVVTETADGKTRTTTTTYDAVDRVTRVEVTSDDGAVQLPAVETEYSRTSGDVTFTRSGSAIVRRDYDQLGRLLTYTDADGGTTRTEFDRSGRPTKVTDNSGSTTYTYDGGRLTKVTDSVAGEFSAEYAPDGRLVELTYPGGLTRRDTLDASSTPVGRTYTRDSDGVTVHSESVTRDPAGRVTSHAYTGGHRGNGYDRAGHLATVRETVGGQCTSRVYGYDSRANRTLKRTFGPATDGTCRTTGAPDTQQASSYDTADRAVDAGYGYDAFSRVTAVPSGAATTYHVDGVVAGQQQGSGRQTWTLDPGHRPRRWTVEQQANGAWSRVASKLNHYGGDTDEPRWTVEDTAAGTVTRYVNGPDGILVATTSASGEVKLQLTDLAGSVISTVDTALTAPEIHRYDEFGTPVRALGLRYGWLGGHQRAADTPSGDVLMGTRLYSTTTGRFMQPDSGDCNPYVYGCADPINNTTTT